MTNRIDRLAARDLVRRLPDPTDRRGVQVRLTPSGRQAVDAAMSGLLEHERTMLASLPEERWQTLASLLRDLVAPFDNEAES